MKKNRFYLLSLFPAGIKKIARIQFLSIPFAVYVNLRARAESDGVYGQLSEDSELRKWLPEEKGTYLDIGAGYPVRGSNTYAFYRSGWRGIAIEPILTNAIVYRIFRPRDKVLRALVGSKDGVETFFHLEPYEYSTTKQKIASEMLARQDTKLISTRSVKQVSIRNLNIRYQPLNPTLVSIDTEGADLEILQSFPWEVCNPRVIVAEEWSDYVNPSENLNTFLVSKDYTLVKNLSPSLIFVSNQYLKMRKSK